MYLEKGVDSEVIETKKVDVICEEWKSLSLFFYNTLWEEYDRSFKVGLLGKLAKGAVKLAGKVVVAAHDPRKAGTEEQFIARNIENKVIDNVSSKLLSDDVDEEIDETLEEVKEEV